MPGHGKGRRFDRNANDALACSHMTDIDQKVLRAGSQHAPVVTKAQRTNRPFQSIYSIKKHVHTCTRESPFKIGMFTDESNYSNKRRKRDENHPENVRMQHISSASQRETKASADPVAKYRPLGSNSMQMQLAG